LRTCFSLKEKTNTSEETLVDVEYDMKFDLGELSLHGTSGFRFQTVRVANLMDPYARIGVKPIAWNRFCYTITYSIVQARQTLPTTARSFPP